MMKKGINKLLGDGTVSIETWTPRQSTPDFAFEYIDIASVDREQKTIIGTTPTVAANAPSRARQIVQANDILVSTVRPNLNAVAFVPESLDHAIASTGFCVLRCHPEKLNARYLYYWVRTPQFVKDMILKSTGASYPAVSDRIIKDSRIPIPYADDPVRSLSEQKRIAAILDKADAIRRKRKETVSVAGELVPAMFREVFGEPIANPHNWPTQTLGELLETIDSGRSPKCKDRPATDDEWGVLKLGAVTYCEYDDKENKALPSGVTERPNLEVKRGDILFTRKNTYKLVAASVIVRETRPQLMLPDLIFRLCIKKGVSLLPEYLWQLLIHPRKRAQIQTLAGGSSGSMPNISKQRLSSVVIPLPPRELQENFAKNLNACLDTRKRLANEAQTESNNLFNSLVQRAFKGEL